MKIILFTILFVFIGTVTMAQHSNFYAMPKKANRTFSLIDTSNTYLLKKKPINKLEFGDLMSITNDKRNFIYKKSEMPCKKEFVNVSKIPNVCKNGTKIFAAPIPNAIYVMK
jgi:hypothetical protein